VFFVATLGELLVVLLLVVAPKPCAIANNRRAAIVAVAESLVILLVSMSGAMCVCCSLVCRSDLVELRSVELRSVDLVAGPVLDKLANRKSLDLALLCRKENGGRRSRNAGSHPNNLLNAGDCASNVSG
jgi:hypothetical protein